MLKLMRTIGAAVIMGMGAKAGSELYEVLRDRARRSRGGTAADATVDGEARSADAGNPRGGVEEDLEETESRLEAERERIDRELERLRRKRARRR
jgi:hypothetical protein